MRRCGMVPLKRLADGRCYEEVVAHTLRTLIIGIAVINNNTLALL